MMQKVSGHYPNTQTNYPSVSYDNERKRQENDMPTQERSGATITLSEPAPRPEPRAWKLFTAIAIIWLSLYIIALTGYPNLVDNEQRVGAYILDAVHNGHWIMQHDASGDVASKPPMLTWLASIATLAVGRLNRFTIYLPSALATLGLAWSILAAGRIRFGWLAGFLGALAYLLSPLADAQVVTARYDGLFAFPIALAALAAFRSWNTGRDWVWFWLAATFATLVKGPLGLLLGGAGLVAAFWEKRSGKPQPIRGSHLLGIILFLAISAGWFALAYRELGQPLIDKLLGSELARHALNDGDNVPGSGFYGPIWGVFSIFLPWSIFGGIGLWRVWKNPSHDDATRRFERFLFCWFFVGLFIFSVASHQRGRLILPLIPALAMLAGREMERLSAAFSIQKIFKLAAAVAVLTLTVLTLYRHVLLGGVTVGGRQILRQERHTEATLAIKRIADTTRERVGEGFPLTHFESPFALQFYLNTVRPSVSARQAAELLTGEEPAFIVTKDLAEITAVIGKNSASLHELARGDSRSGNPLRLLSNHATLEWTPHVATYLDSVKIIFTNGRDLKIRGNQFWLTLKSADGSVRFENRSAEKRAFRVHLIHNGSDAFREHELSPGETWEAKL
jgi:4-amino-4-deoxy-L-arabinose transferase-like glycosyltransferase